MLALREGVDSYLESFADLILADDRRAYRRDVCQVGSQHLPYGILSPDQQALREEREQLTTRGNFDVGVDRGIYGRVWVDRPHRPTSRRRLSLPQDPWRQEAYEFMGQELAGAWLPVANREEVVGGQHYQVGAINDPAWAHYGNARDYACLDRFQRSRIRAAMRKVPWDRPDVGWLLRDVLAAHYGVPSWMIVRICRAPVKK